MTRAPEPEDVIPGWLVEKLYPDFAQGFREDRIIYDNQANHQRFRVIENARFGRVLTLDGVVQTTEIDEFIYHEMMAHVPIFAHGAVADVLIIGGGDGGMAREVLKHKGIESLTQVEIDERVIAFSKQYLPTLSDGAFEDPRLRLVIDDGAAFLASTKEQFDVIIVDSTDPIGPGAALFTKEFYADAERALTRGGILVTQNGVPFMQAEELADTYRSLRKLFTDAGCYLATIPTYAGGPMAFGWATNSSARQVPVETLEARYVECGFSTRYYTPAVHKAAFALPGYVLDILHM
jgi:spermidine synthase